MADICNLNKKIAHLLVIPHVSSVSHQPNKEIERMVAKDNSRELITSVLDTMNDCRSDLKNRHYFEILLLFLLF